MKYIYLFIFLFIFSGTVSSQVNGSLYFDGVDDHITFSRFDSEPPVLANSSFTIEMWARKAANTDGYAIRIGNVETYNEYLHVGWSSSVDFNFGFFSNDLQVYSGDDGLWHHWAVTYDADSAPGIHNRKIYKDGVLVASDESPSDFTGTATMEMGRAIFGSAQENFAGHLDMLRIWTKALTESEINDKLECTVLQGTAGLYEEYIFSNGIPNGNNPTKNFLPPSSIQYSHAGDLQNFALNGTFSNWVDDAQIVFPNLIEPFQDQNLVVGEELILAPNLDLGTCPSNYFLYWHKDNVYIQGENNATLVIADASIADAGEYHLEILDNSSTRVFYTDTITVARNPTLIATDQSSDYFIDVDWIIPITPCLFDSNTGDPYDIVTTRLLRNGEEIFYQTYEDEELDTLYSDNNVISGSLRDYVGPDQNVNYEMMVYVGPYGFLSDECGSLTDQGSTSDVKVPTIFSVSENLLDRINISWLNHSDLVTSYKLFRDENLIATLIDGIAKNDTTLYADTYNFNNGSSIVSGENYNYTLEVSSSFINQTWEYPIGLGNTLDIDFTASQTETDKVLIDWLDTASPLIDEYRLYRKNKLYATKSTLQNDHIDIYPHYGDSINYQLRLIEDDTIRAAYTHQGYVLPNGTISGRVITEEGQFPVRDVLVNAIRESTGDTLMTMSNTTGDFVFTDIAYGLLDSFKLQASQVGHKFNYFPKQTIGLSTNNSSFSQIKIVDSVAYPQGNTMFELEANVNTFDDQDKTEISWEYTSNSAELFFDISRNGEIIYAVTNPNPIANTTGTYTDLTGISNEDTEYTVRIYDILGNALSSISEEVTCIFPKVSRIPDGAFTVEKETINTEDTGNTTLQWTHTSQNIDAFRIYRNDSLIAELSKDIFDYTDTEAPFDSSLYYTITAIRNIENTTYETNIPTTSTPSFINLGTMPSPATVTASGESAIPSMMLTWTIPAQVNANFDYTGYCIYRNGTLLRKQDKSLPLSYEDFGAIGMNNITYKVSLYRAGENGILESSRISSNSLDHPSITPNLQLNATAVPAEGLVNLTWSQFPAASTYNSDGYAILYLGDTLIKLPPYIYDYKHYPTSGSSHNYKLYKYKTINGVDMLSAVDNSNSANMSELTGVVYPPQNVVASRNLPNHVKLCWEYLDFVESSFEITKNNIIIDTLTSGTRAYYDYDADPTDHMLAYQVRALNGDQVSKYVGAVGDVIGHKLIYGQVTDPDTKLGIENVTIFRTINGLKNVVTQTDSAGYYSFPAANELIGTSLTIEAYYSNGVNATTDVTISAAKHYEVNLVLDIPTIFPYTNLAEVEYADVDVDIYDLSGIISWQPTNSNYDGMEVSRGLNVLANVPKDDGNIFIDTSAVPGIGYTYVFRAYRTTSFGKEYSSIYEKQCSYPPISPVINLTATPLVEENSVQIQWSHLYDHADGYEISRNGKIINIFEAGSPFTYKDSTGTAGEQFTYTLRAFSVKGGVPYFSEEKSVSVIYPQPAKVTNLRFDFPYLTDVENGNTNFPYIIPIYYLNRIKISWDYKPYFSKGYRIFRDNQLIATVPADSLSYIDSYGTPDAAVTYSVSAIISQNGVSNESKKAEKDTIFPSVETPYGITITPFTSLGQVKLSWKYQTPGVDYFELEFWRNYALVKTEIIPCDNDIQEETLFEYIDKETAPHATIPVGFKIKAVSTRNNVVSKSPQTSTTTVLYPFAPITNCDATKGTYDKAVKITWDSPAGANIDSFTISKSRYTYPGIVYVGDIVVAGGERSYVDIFEDSDVIGGFQYIVKAGRIINGTYTIVSDEQNECSSDGYPQGAADSEVNVNYGGQTQYSSDIAVDGGWMAVSRHDNNEVFIYKFENGSWVNTQLLSKNNGSFGSSVALDDKILVIGAPDVIDPTSMEKVGAAYFYRLDGEMWEEDQAVLGTIDIIPDPGFGAKVAIDDGKIVVGYKNVIDYPVNNAILNYLFYIKVFDRGTCDYASPCTYTEIPIALPDEEIIHAHPDSTPYFIPGTEGPYSIAIEGNDIALGFPSSSYKGESSPNSLLTGRVTHLTIGSTVEYKGIFTDLESYENGYQAEFFGGWVGIHDDKIAVSSLNGIVDNISSGKVSIFEEAAGDWNKVQTLEPIVPIQSGYFSRGLVWNGDFIGVTETILGTPDEKVYLFKENTNGFELVHSPDPNDQKYREEFFDSGNPDKYPGNFTISMDMSDNHLVVGSTSSGQDEAKAYSFDLFKVKINNLSASDGIHTNTLITWDIGGCDDCPEGYIDSFNIYRDAVLIGQIPGSNTQFSDDLTGVQEAVSGKKYIYEVEAAINPSFDYLSSKSLDTGYSKRKGRISGDVLVSGSNSGVSGVDIEIIGFDLADQTTYTYQTTSLSNGSFLFKDLYIGNSIEYSITPSYLDHDLDVKDENGNVINDSNPILLTDDTPEQNFIQIFDNTAFAISGQVKTQGSSCGIPEIIVNFYETVNGVEFLVDTTRTDKDGFYSMIVDPNKINLSKIKIELENLQTTVSQQGDTSSVQYNFYPNARIYTNFVDFPVITTLDFVDTLTYPITISVENTCGFALADQPVLIRISSTDGCLEYNDQTDNQGELFLNLPPKKYLLAVEGIVGSGVDNYENAGIDFLSLRPFELDLLGMHEEAGDSDTLPTIDQVKYVYHRAVSFAYTSSFVDFKCNESDQPAILTQGNKHSMNFVLSENHRPGESCEVQEGYITVKNSGATQLFDTLYRTAGAFETYSFTAGSPNLVPPHTLSISLQYFSDKGSLLGSKIIPIFVTGQRLLPGTGIITDALTDDAGDLQMPLLVLRDPPGDGSYSSIESGSSITKSLDFSGEASGSGGFYLESDFTIFGAGGFANVDVGLGGSTSNSNALDFSISTSETYSTSSSDNAVGREANVIVGAGISSQYGLTQILSFENGNCDPKTSEIISFGIGGFNSTYGYTVAFIEGLIDEYKQDSLLVEKDELKLIRADGSPYSKAEARLKYASLIQTWLEMLHYHDVETAPHYVLCQDFSYRDDLDANAQALYDGWRDGFCTQIGSYNQNDEFTMDEEITWTPALISAYNNAIAFTDAIKEVPLDYIDNGDLDVTSFDISANSLNVTNQFHNTLGNAAKSAEVFDISGNVAFDRTITAQQSSSTSKSFSRFFYLDLKAGAKFDLDISSGFAISRTIVTTENKIGYHFKTQATLSVNSSQAESNHSTISYHIFDDDPEDQVTFLALQAPLQDQTPFFIRLGGLSSCPQEEELTINQDNSPLLIDDPTITVIVDPDGASTPNPNPVYGVDPDEAAVFEVQMGNLGPTGLPRDAMVFLDLASNPFGAIVKIGGSNLNIVSPIFSIPAGGSITQFLTVEKPSGIPFYVFEGLRIGIKPACGGEAKYIELDVYFESPCSPISITKPFEGMIVKRINPYKLNDREIIQYELRDFQANNPLLEHVQLQYKRLGTGKDWQHVPGGMITRQQLADSTANLPVGQDPLYLFEWDITGEYNLYPDGQYKVRAYAFCGVSGRQYSNETEITLARSGLLITGYPEPADNLWTLGDEISTTYTTNIDCGLYSVLDNEDILDYLTLIDLETMMPVPFTHQCQNDKLTVIPTGEMSLYDGHKLRATYKDITNIIGNNAQDVIWDFKVVTQSVDWEEPMIEVTLFENQVKTVNTLLFNSTDITVNGLTLAGTESWFSFNPMGTFLVPGDETIPVELTFDGNIGKGTYMTTLQVNGLTGRVPTIMVKLNVLQSVPTPNINGPYNDSMELILNWSFLPPMNQPSTDLNDVIQVYKDGLIRGYANIEEQGNFYFTRIKVYGNAEDENGKLDFVIWNADQPQAYTPISITDIKFKANTTRGVLTNPEILLVDDDLYEFRGRIYVDSMNVSGTADGKSWLTAFPDLQNALAVANDADTIWMSGGIYYPSVADKSESFVINESIAILGGFENGMTSASQRTGNNETILSGNIGIKATTSDNSYHVVRSSATDILLDMLTISDGNADGTLEDGKGGCFYNSGEVTLINCTMSNGQAQEAGSLIYNNGTLTLDGGTYYIPASSSVSNLQNDVNGIINISNTVNILQE